MEMSFRNEGFHQYIIFSIEEFNMEGYEMNMLMQFHGDSLLPLKLYGQNGNMQIQYEITGSATLKQVSDEHELEEEFLRTLFRTIWDCYRELEEYLLPVGGILLEPDMIYYQPGRKQLRFCYLPHQKDLFEHNFLTLTEFCMKHVNHKDLNAVMFIYELYRHVQGGHMEWEEIERYLYEEEAPPLPKEESKDTGREQVQEVMPAKSSMEEDRTHKPRIAFYIYGGGFLLSLCAMVFFGIRFFMITGRQQDLKYLSFWFWSA